MPNIGSTPWSWFQTVCATALGPYVPRWQRADVACKGDPRKVAAGEVVAGDELRLPACPLPTMTTSYRSVTTGSHGRDSSTQLDCPAPGRYSEVPFRSCDLAEPADVR